MRIVFYNDASDELTPQMKGILFERFCRRLVSLLGYGNITLRAKHSSLEYDIDAESLLTGRTLLGEAKAQEVAMSGKEVSAFVGKVVPLAINHGPTDAVFISLSAFTAEAVDYLRTVNGRQLEVISLTLRTLVGNEIPKLLRERGELVGEDLIRDRVRQESGLEPQDVWLVVGKEGDFVLATCGASSAVAASHFMTFSARGTERLNLTDETAAKLRSQVPDTQGMVYLRSVHSGVSLTCGVSG